MKSDEQKIRPTSKILNEDLFWSIVEGSTNSRDEEEQIEKLESEIETLSPTEMIGFRLRTDQLLHQTYTSEMWCAGYIMNGGCSDDGFEYFRCWVISLGKEAYYNAKKDPDTLISQAVANKDYFELEDFWYVALTAFENKTGEELYDYIADDFSLGEGNYPPFEFNWEEGNPESMKAICPQLFEKFWS